MHNKPDHLKPRTGIHASDTEPPTHDQGRARFLSPKLRGGVKQRLAGNQLKTLEVPFFGTFDHRVG